MSAHKWELCSRYKELSVIPKQPKLMIIKNNEGLKQIVLGDNQTIKLSGKETSGKFLLIEENNEPNVGIPEHTHTYEDEVFTVIEGKLELYINGEKVILNKGDTAYCPKGISHSWRTIGNQPTKVILSIFPAGIEELFFELAELKEFDFEKVKKLSSNYGITFK